jgi:myosin V
MNVVHISKEDQDTVFSMLAAVLWLGNISFKVIDNENHIEVVSDEGIVLSSSQVIYNSLLFAK